MGKRHKRRRMVNRLAPHRGSVILTENPEMLGPSVTGLSLFSTMQPQRSRPLRSDFLFSAISLPETTASDRKRLTNFGSMPRG